MAYDGYRIYKQDITELSVTQTAERITIDFIGDGDYMIADQVIDMLEILGEVNDAHKARIKELEEQLARKDEPNA